MVAEIAIYPMGETHFSEAIAEVINEIKCKGLNYRIGPMGTSVEGSVEDVFDLLKRCFSVVEQKHSRCVMNVSLDNRPASRLQGMDGMIQSVLSRVEAHSPHS